jgi:hypothetical protein
MDAYLVFLSPEKTIVVKAKQAELHEAVYIFRDESDKITAMFTFDNILGYTRIIKGGQ